MHYLSVEFISDRRHWGWAQQPFYILVPRLCFMINVLKVLYILPRVHINYRLAEAITLLDPPSQLQAPLHRFSVWVPKHLHACLALPLFEKKKEKRKKKIQTITGLLTSPRVIIPLTLYGFISPQVNTFNITIWFIQQLKMCSISFNVRNTLHNGIMSALWWSGDLSRLDPPLPASSCVGEAVVGNEYSEDITHAAFACYSIGWNGSTIKTTLPFMS